MLRKLYIYVLWKLISFIAILRKYKIWDFPNGLCFVNLKRNTQILATLVAQRLAVVHRGKPAELKDNLLKDPFLKFHANYSLTHVELNTPGTVSLANDLNSILDLKDKKILCLGARNLDEIFQLRLNGAKKSNITAVDLYSYIPEILPMDFHDLKFPKNSFDIVFYTGSFCYSHAPINALREAVRVLKPNGYIAIGDAFGVGGATSVTYRSKYSKYVKMQSRVKDALNEITSSKTLLTQYFPNIQAVEKLFDNFKCTVILRRTYAWESKKTAHFNIITKF